MRTTFARQVAPRRAVRTWWGKAWQRAVEEATYSEAELRAGRASARRGDVGGITVDAGRLLAAVRDDDDAWTVEVVVPTLDDSTRQALVDVVAAEAGRIAALLAGELPHDLVEHAEEAGVELLPYGGELAATCTCPHYVDPCPHAVATLTQAGWLLDADPLVLFALRGLDRDALLADLHAARELGFPSPELGFPSPELGLGPSESGFRTPESGLASADSARASADDVELVVDAALRARRALELLEAGEELPDGLV